jgi:putative two-component system response regulator
MTEPDRAHILIVDDQPDNLLILEDLLGERHVVHSLDGGHAALAYLNDGGPADLILLDVMMPGLDGFEVCRALKQDPATSAIPVIFLTTLSSAVDEERGLSLGAEDFIHKPFSPAVVFARVRNHLRLSQSARLLRNRNEDLERLVSDRTRHIVEQAAELVRRKQQLIAAQDATISAFCSLAEARDYETGNHIRRTQHYVRAIAEQVRDRDPYRSELSDETIDLLFKSAPLHDVGKVAIPDAVLLKPGKLDREEWEVMKQHTVLGRDAILQAEADLVVVGDSFLRHAREIATSHHERWDGTGYPDGLAGTAIPLSARIMAIADVYDALISRRVYKPAYPHEDAVHMIMRERGTHFDPALADAFFEIRGKFLEIAERFTDAPDQGATTA